ncbi:MAG TPA: SWIM zinc finger family protein [Burkholderiaceae bacterium]|nr:SWIM zinc finger family protein [Burkholderiaceae bacterium]
MTPVAIAYASPSTLQARRGGNELTLAANLLQPVALHAEVAQHGAMLRLALRTFGQALWDPEHRLPGAQALNSVLDPVLTVHPDRIGLEAFTQDQGAYLSLQIEPEVFRLLGEPHYGSSHIDFSAWLWQALGEMRTSRRTWLRVDASAGQELGTTTPLEQRLDLPGDWVRGLLDMQRAMAQPGTRLRLRPVDLQTALHFLALNPARVSPPALRYDLRPGEPATLVIEPFEHRLVLQEAVHDAATAHSVRTWGRRKLGLLEPLLPFAWAVHVDLKSHEQPSAYTVRLPGMSVTLGLPGTGLPSPPGAAPAAPALQLRALHTLADAFHATTPALANALNAGEPDTAAALAALARAGRVMADLHAGGWRHRELFVPPLDTATLFPPEPCREAALRLLAEPGGVQVRQIDIDDPPRARGFRHPDSGERIERVVAYPQWRIRGASQGFEPEIVVGDEEQLAFASCGCEFYQEHLLTQGPCPHTLALLWQSGPQRRELARVHAAPAVAPRLPRAAPERAATGGEGGGA